MIGNTTIGTAAVHVSIAKLFGLVSAFISSLLIAREFGSNAVTDTFFIGLTIPNTLFVILAAAVPSVFIPLFSDFLVQSREREAWEFGASTARIGIVLIAGIVGLGFLFSTVLVRWIAPGFSEDQIVQASFYQQILFFMVLFGSVAAFLRGVLNSYRIFAVPALDGFASNLLIIAFILLFSRRFGVLSIVLGTVAGSLFRVLIQAPSLWKVQRVAGIIKRSHHPGTAEFLRLILPLLGFHFLVACYMMIGRHFTSHLKDDGAISYLNYSEKLIGFPIEMVAAAFAVALLPSLSEFASSRRDEEFAAHTLTVLKTALLLLMPIMMVFIILREPLVQVIFERGRFTHANTIECARVLMFYSLAILASLGMILTQVFFAMRMTLVLFGIGIVCLILNVVLCQVLIGPLHVSGVALSISITQLTFFILLLVVLARKLKHIRWSETVVTTLKIMFLTACMTGIVLGMDRTFLAHAPPLIRLSGGGAGFLVYLGLAYLIRVGELRMLFTRWRG